MNNTLLARSADALYWLARYVERAENLARILDVNDTFARDRAGGQNWLSIVQLNADRDAFFARHPTADAPRVIGFYVADTTTPTPVEELTDTGTTMVTLLVALWVGVAVTG